MKNIIILLKKSKLLVNIIIEDTVPIQVCSLYKSVLTIHVLSIFSTELIYISQAHTNIAFVVDNWCEFNILHY